MASQSPRNASLDLVALSPTGITPAGLAQYKLCRLRELRGVIESLRCEHQAQDPLLAWVIEHEHAGAHTTA